MFLSLVLRHGNNIRLPSVSESREPRGGHANNALDTQIHFWNTHQHTRTESDVAFLFVPLLFALLRFFNIGEFVFFRDLVQLVARVERLARGRIAARLVAGSALLGKLGFDVGEPGKSSGSVIGTRGSRMTWPADDVHVLVYVDRVCLAGEVVRLDDLACLGLRSLAAEQEVSTRWP